eukprot:15330035-Ditylum_brightwellii.AAC.1
MLRPDYNSNSEDDITADYNSGSDNDSYKSQKRKMRKIWGNILQKMMKSQLICPMYGGKQGNLCLWNQNGTDTAHMIKYNT